LAGVLKHALRFLQGITNFSALSVSSAVKYPAWAG
jgi:hypothetical protein